MANLITATYSAQVYLRACDIKRKNEADELSMMQHYNAAKGEDDR